MNKKKILLCGEFTALATGFGIYGHEVMKRLHATGKYELAEFGAYGGTEINDETRHRQIPWKYYPNMPQNKEESDMYRARPTNQWGEWKFEATLLDFKPDIVWDIRDWWMFEYEERSALRRYFSWYLMPTVDSAPQEDQWLATFMNADGILTYSDWGKNLLEESGIKVVGTAPPGFDNANYISPANKSKHKLKMGVSEDCFIVGTVMRNQRRKLYPDLIEAFKMFLAQAPKAISEKSYLYLHCAYPDIAWNIPKLIKEAGLSNKTLLTYSCNDCHAVFPSFYQDVVGYCQNCGNYKASLPRSQAGISNFSLGNIIGLMDAYVQYSTCEGFGMPQVEASACGVPVFAVDYSAMADVVRKVKGYPIKVQRYFRESETHTYKALPDNQDLVDKLIALASMSKEERNKKSLEVAKAAQSNYSWDKTAKVWEDLFDGHQTKPKMAWNAPSQAFVPKQEMPDGMSNQAFVHWCFENILGRPDLTTSFLSAKILRDLNWGVCAIGTDGGYFNELSSLGIQTNHREFTRKEVVNLFLSMNQTYNFWECERTKQEKK